LARLMHLLVTLSLNLLQLLARLMQLRA
jgi:hypothetical protein